MLHSGRAKLGAVLARGQAVSVDRQAVSARGRLHSTSRFRPNKAAIPEPVCSSPGPLRRLWYKMVVGRQSGPAAPPCPPAVSACGAQQEQETGAGRGGAVP